LLVVFVFGIAGVCVGLNWLSSGNIVIRQGQSRIGAGGASPRPAPQSNAPVAGSIGVDSGLYYPLCLSWIGLGIAMVALGVISCFSSNELYSKLAAYSCLVFFLLVGATVTAALCSGP
jgi:hypothetical protein